MRLRHTFALIFAGVFLQGCLEAVPSQTPSGQPAAQPASATTVSATASNAPEYPVALATPAMQRELGIGESFANKCYYYGDGGTTLTVSNQFLAKYKARGFSLRTMCMGLVSEIRFHPETGKRLATVILGEGPPRPPEVRRAQLLPFNIALTSEFPVQLPGCFRRGLPLSDCRFSYSPYTGERLSRAATAETARFGARALQIGRTMLADGKYARACGAGEELDEDEKCYVEVIRAGPNSGSTAGHLAREFYVNDRDLLPLGGFVDFSPALPEGFGYAIFADGSAGPSFDMASASLKIDGKSRASQADLDALKILVASE